MNQTQVRNCLPLAVFVLLACCSHFHSTCTDVDFTCKNDECIPRKYICDGHEDCKDLSDEKNCDDPVVYLRSEGKNPCSEAKFWCGNSSKGYGYGYGYSGNTCIDQYYVCNDERNCDNGIDETYCVGFTRCTRRQFRCGSGECISQTSVCNRNKDCRDNSDESECSTGHPESAEEFSIELIEGVKEARTKAHEWLIEQRRSDWGWKKETPRALVALSLSSQDWSFSNNTLETDLMVKQLKIEIQETLLNEEDLNPTALALSITALLATCQNPEAFQGLDLVAQLLKKSYNETPIVFLSLCLAGNVSFLSHFDINFFLNNEDYLFNPDNYLIAVLAASCVVQHQYKLGYDLKSKLVKTIRQAHIFLWRVRRYQQEDGSFGSIHTTALAVQAFMTLGNDNKNYLVQAIKYILQQQLPDGSFGDFLATYYILPVLYGRTLLDLSYKKCPPPYDNKEISLWLQKGEIQVRYSIWIGNNIDYSYTTEVILSRNITAFDVIKAAAKKDDKLRFKWKEEFGQTYIYSINGVPNDPDSAFYWTLYYANSVKENFTRYNKGVKNLRPKSRSLLLMWYKGSYSSDS